MLAAVPAVTTSCVRDLGHYSAPAPEYNDDVMLRITVPSPPSPTRALVAADEYAVREINVLAFNTGDSPTFKGDYTGRIVPGSLTPGEGASATLDFEVTLPVGTFDLMMVANGTSILSSAGRSLTSGASQSAVENALTMNMTTDGWNTDTTSPAYAAMPMWGYAKGVEVASKRDFIDSGDNKARLKRTVYLTRMVAKVNVTLGSGLSAATKPDDPATPKFVLESVRVYNYNKQGYLIPNTGDANFDWSTIGPHSLGVDKGQAPRIPAGSATNPDTEYIERRANSSSNKLEGEIYLFEAAAGVAPAGGGDYTKNVHLVIGGRFMGGSTSYYRIDFARNTGTPAAPHWVYLPVLRNNSYSVTVADISGNGSPTPEKARESVSANIEAYVLDWFNHDIHYIVSNETYMLGVSQGSFALQRPAHTEAGDENSLLVTTDYAEGWKAEVFDDNGTGKAPGTGTDSREWLGIVATLGNGDYPSGNRVHITTTENNTEKTRTGWIRITAGNLHYNIKVEQTSVIPYQIKIVDADGKPVDRLIFAGDDGNGGAPQPQTFTVKWMPSDRPLSIVRVQQKTTADMFTWQSQASNKLTSLAITPGDGAIENSYTFTIDPAAIKAETPIYNRGVDITFTLADGEGKKRASAEISLYQGNNYSSIVPALTTHGHGTPLNGLRWSHLGGQREVIITSYANVSKDGKLTQYPVSWMAEFSIDGGTTWTDSPPEWLGDFPVTGGGYDPAIHTGGARFFPVTGAPAIITIDDPVSKALAEAPKRGTPEKRWNLANPAGEPDIIETANCYVVGAQGHYKLPLYYGNAYENPKSYQGSSGNVTNYVNHAGERIDGNPIAGAASATYVWQEHKSMLTNIALEEGYLIFDVEQTNIREGNAIVAVRDAAGTVMWSWHIWITSLDVSVNNTEAVTNRTLTPVITTVTNDNGYSYEQWSSPKVPIRTTKEFMKHNLGWVTPKIVTYTPNTPCKVRITQTGIANPKTGIIEITQESAVENNAGKNPYWQWGRKDPMPPTGAPAKANIEPVMDWNTGEGFGWEIVELTSVMPLKEAIINPGKFFATSNGNFAVGGHYNLWDADYPNARGMTEAQNSFAVNEVTKTVYDPCPPGFKMPPPNSWTGFVRSAANATGNDQAYSSPNDAGSLNVRNASTAKTTGKWEFYLTPDGEDGDPVAEYYFVGYRTNDKGGPTAYQGFGSYNLYWSALFHFSLEFSQSTLSIRQTPKNGGQSIRPVRDAPPVVVEP
jgi:hypothetical protein